MNIIDLKIQDDYYTTINKIPVHVDFTSQRLKIFDFKNISDTTISDILKFAKEKGLGKVISNSPISLLHHFKNCGFKIEGKINGFFSGKTAYCVSFFIDDRRGISLNRVKEDTILNQCAENTKFSIKEPHKYVIRDAKRDDIPQMIKLFSTVFETYPSPIYSSDYLQKVMGKQILFKVAVEVEDDQIISIASADLNINNVNAEITDCATYPEHRGRGILPNLILCLEKDLHERGFYTLYSLSRAINPGINKTLSKLDYSWCGRLINNCHICGNFEDMNIWVKNTKKVNNL